MGSDGACVVVASTAARLVWEPHPPWPPRCIDSAAMLVHIIRYVVHTTLFAGRAGRERGAAVGSGGGGGGRRLWCRGRWLCRTAGQVGQRDGAEKRQCSGVGPVWKRGGGIEMGGGVTAGPDGLSARPRAVARGAARGDQHVVDHLCQGHREAEHADRDPRPGEVGVQGRGRGGGRPLGRSCTCCKRPSAMSGQRRLSPAHRSQAWSGWSGRSSLMLYSRARGAWALTMAACGRPGWWARRC